MAGPAEVGSYHLVLVVAYLGLLGDTLRTCGGATRVIWPKPASLQPSFALLLFGSGKGKAHRGADPRARLEMLGSNTQAGRRVLGLRLHTRIPMFMGVGL